MINSIKFLKQVHHYQKDMKITFKPHINIIIGRSGSGKSRLLNLFRHDPELSVSINKNSDPIIKVNPHNLLKQTFSDNSVYLIDEPEMYQLEHLDELILKVLKSHKTQFFIITHYSVLADIDLTAFCTDSMSWINPDNYKFFYHHLSG